MKRSAFDKVRQEAEENVRRKIRQLALGLVREVRKLEPSVGVTKFYPTLSTSYGDDFYLKIGGETVNVGFKAEQKRISIYSSKYNGRVRIWVGPYGARQQFMDRTDGHDLAKIADFIVAYAKDKKAKKMMQDRANAISDANRKCAEAINKRYGIGGMSKIWVSGDGETMRIHIVRLTSAEQINPIIEAALKVVEPSRI